MKTPVSTDDAPSQVSNFVIYHSDEENISINATIKDETLWLTQKAMAELYGIDKSGISRHLNKIFEEGELNPDMVIAFFATTAQHGAIPGKTQSNKTAFYNLDAIIAVGYRINSHRATRFRIWATSILKEYIIKGFVMDDERLKQGSEAFGKDYFRELLERVRSIRASERRIWLQITDIFAECSIDYNKNSDTARKFYATVQNKFHYAITGKTAAEIVHSSADASKPKMGLTTYKNAPDGRVLQSDVTIAKNYLDEKQIRKLERNVSGYFDYVEDLIEEEHVFTMEDFAKSIDDFLNFRKYKILQGNGSISKTLADAKAKKEYSIFNKTQKINSDFEKQISELSNES